MKTIKFLGTSIFLSIILVSLVHASQQFDNLIKLVKSGTSKEVIVTFINASDSGYNFSSDEIVALKAAGAPSEVIIAAINHKGVVPANAQARPPRPARLAEPSAQGTMYGVPPPWRYGRAARDWYFQKVSTMDQALQFNFIGMLFGTFTANYEYLFGHQHGVALEGNYYFNGEDSHGENAELMYRFHLSKSMNSGFVGAFIKGGRYYGSDENAAGSLVPYTQTSVTIGPNIGERWVSPSGFSMVGRIGYGYTWSEFDNYVPDRHTRDVLRQRAGLDMELSFGYAF